MKQYILLLVLMVMGAGMTVHAEDVNPVKVGNVISGHINRERNGSEFALCHYFDCRNRAGNCVGREWRVCF